MVNYINDHKSGERYVIIDNPTKSRILGMVEYGVDYGQPVIGRLKFSKGGSWDYSTNGHFLNANGYTTDGEEIVLTDPNIKRVNPSAGGNYWVTLDELYQATDDHFADEMAY